MNLAKCGGLPQTPLHGTWYRALSPMYLTPKRALAFAHTKRLPSRFNDGRGVFSTLYLAQDQIVALFEVEGVLGSPYSTWLPTAGRNLTILSVTVTLQAVADLTRAAAQAHLATTAQELTGDWSGYHLRHSLTPVSQPAGIPAPTQELGAELFANGGTEAFISVSAKIPTHQILVVFPDRLMPGSQIICHDEMGKVLAAIAPARRPRRKRST